ncbi:MAG: ABC transporter substrate-binding protein [Thermomicrobiales bacterium]
MIDASRRELSRRHALLGITSLTLGALAAPHIAEAQATPVAATPGAGAFPVTITHINGETIIPARPERIVAASDFLDLDALLTLGLTPVAYGAANGATGQRLPWQDAAEGIPTFDAATDLDLEAITAAQPDLIITMPKYFDDWYETLSAIAPTVVIDWDDPWRDALRMVGRATGEEARADAEVARAEALIADARAAMAPAAEMPLMVGFMYTTELWIWGEDMSAGQLFRELGLDFVGGEDPVMTVVSLEQADQLRPAQILLSAMTDPDAIAKQEASPIFQSLPAVKRGGYGLLTIDQTSALADSVSPLSLAWALPGFVDLILQLAAGEGKLLP